MADRFPLPAETGADEPDVDRPRPPVEARSIAKLLSFQRPRALRARPRSLANRLAKHKSGASSGRRQEVRAQPQKLRNALERPGRVEDDGARLRRGKPLLEVGEGERDPLHSHEIDALEAARAIERVPELLGLSPHLLATARRHPRLVLG